jgi:hypothetical protein
MNIILQEIGVAIDIMVGRPIISISTLMRPSDWGEAYDQSLSKIGKREGIALISCTVAL